MPRTRSAPTIHDVANAAGVSVSTVSRVLNDKDDVAAETVARVRGVIENLGYESSMAARSMRSSRTHVIGLIMPDMDHSYGVEIIKAASRVITGTPYDLIAMTSGSKNHTDRGLWQQQRVRRLNGTITDGVIIVVPDAADYDTGYPLVAIDRIAENATYATVSSDNVGGARAIMSYLLALGHTRIGYIDGLAYLESAVHRRAGYIEALEAAGLPVDPALMQSGDFTRGGGAFAMRRLAALPQPPTAVFACNDDMALGVLDVAAELGIQVPNELSLVGYDNVPEAAATRPALTTVDQGIDSMVQTAMHMLLQMIGGREVAQDHVTLPSRLIVRDSCAPVAVPKGGDGCPQA
jgi:LacI family transcriptional regulator